MSKAFLMAFFSYQVFYWLWVRLENDEEKREKEGGYFRFSVEWGANADVQSAEEVSGLFGEVEKLRRGAK